MSNLVLSGLNLAMYGMGFVFVFLLLLVGLTVLMSSLVRRFSPVVAIAHKQYSSTKRLGKDRQSDTKIQSHSANEANTRLVAILTAAIAQHRSNKS